MLIQATTLSDPPCTCSLDNPPSISAEELHEILLATHSAGNTARRRFIDALRAMQESRLYRQLGFPNIAAYADATFHYARTQVFEFLRVSKALVDLPRISAAFEQGEISWSLVAELTRVTDRDHEGEWLEFFEGRPVGSVEAELRDARAKHRRHPRKDGYGLPGLPVRLSFELSPQDHAVVARGLEKVASEMGESLDGARPAPVEALVYLLRRVLETEESVTEGRAERAESPFVVVFHQCSDCRRAAVETEDGRVEIAPEALECSASSAEVVRIEPEESPASLEERDRPNSPNLRRALRHREGGRCANPYCRQETGARGHGHHIRFRSQGGRTNLQNEVWCCVRCHAAIHAGCLTVESDAERGLVWRTRAEGLAQSVRASLERARSLPEVRVPEIRSESGGADSRRSSIEEDVIAALVRLGCTRGDAESRLEKAWRSFRAQNEPSSASALLCEALHPHG
jgi:hypothetical protein